MQQGRSGTHLGSPTFWGSSQAISQSNVFISPRWQGGKMTWPWMHTLRGNFGGAVRKYLWNADPHLSRPGRQRRPRWRCYTPSAPQWPAECLQVCLTAEAQQLHCWLSAGKKKALAFTSNLSWGPAGWAFMPCEAKKVQKQPQVRLEAWKATEGQSRRWQFSLWLPQVNRGTLDQNHIFPGCWCLWAFEDVNLWCVECKV